MNALWTREEAISLINELWNPIEERHYYIALTGSVLTRGWGDKDLDLMFYASFAPQHTYVPVLDYLTSFGFKPIIPIQREGQPDCKLVFFSKLDGRRVDLFFPSFSFKDRLDKLVPFNMHYKETGELEDHHIVSHMMEIISPGEYLTI